MSLFEATGDLRWKRMAHEVIANVLFLQARNGGFMHAGAEAEPVYVPNKNTCPIHQFLPIVALLEYAAWPHADGDLLARIRPAIDNHWQWSLQEQWRMGNAWQARPLKFPGWCGVTNQDMVAIASLVLYAQVYGDSSRFERYGAPSLEVYMGPDYYFPAIGLMERGDSANFVERSVYYEVTLAMLEVIGAYTGDERIREMVDNITAHLFDAIFTWRDGRSHLRWGAETWPEDKTLIKGWIRTPMNVGGYPGLLTHMHHYLERHPDGEKAAQVKELERTLASYVLADGTIVPALGTTDPLFSVATSADGIALSMWLFLMQRLGDRLRNPAYAPTGCIHRTRNGLTWKSNEMMWAVEQDGQRRFAGLKLNPGAIAVGPDEALPGANLAELDDCDIAEVIEF